MAFQQFQLCQLDPITSQLTSAISAKSARREFAALPFGNQPMVSRHGSLQSYLSAINQWYADMGFERPAVGHVIQRLRRGFGELEGADDDGEAVACRRPIQASVMFKVLRLASSLRHVTSHRSRLLRRACTASALAFGFMLRADSLVQLRRRDVIVSAAGLVLRLQVKTRSRSISTTVHRPGTDELYLLIKDWLSDCLTLSFPASLFLPLGA